MQHPIIRVEHQACTNERASSTREWLLSDGRGGYACGTVANIPTRRYHGLLVAATDPPATRTLLLHSVHERIECDGTTTELDAVRWADDVVRPRGFEQLLSFELKGRTPVWVWQVGTTVLERRIGLDDGVVEIRWRVLEAKSEVTLWMPLLVANRSHHALHDPDHDTPPKCRLQGQDATIHWPAAKADAFDGPLHLTTNGDFTERAKWWRGIRLAIEEERGFPAIDSAWHAVDASFTLQPGDEAFLRASTDAKAMHKRTQLLADAEAADARLLQNAGIKVESHSSSRARLVLAADQFIVRRAQPENEDSLTILAGYPWFTDWGRDAMIALPGLCLATGRLADAISILKTFAHFERDGLIPNCFGDNDAPPLYNTVDASLWFIHATHACLQAGASAKDIAPLWPTLCSIHSHYRDGTRFGIHVDPSDGLLVAGEAGVQLTWMDAKVGQHVITPRIGKPVEINALWLHGLSCLSELALVLGEDSAPFAKKQDNSHRFWNDATGELFDVIDGLDGNDSTRRPNQVIALALDSLDLTQKQKQSALHHVEASLVVPCALRTLSPDDPQFVPRYLGTPATRDSSYHQGIAWPWLFGFWLEASARINPEQAHAVRSQAIDQLEAHLHEGGLGSVSELLDPTQPFTPRGCFAQAWSVSTILCALWPMPGVEHDE